MKKTIQLLTGSVLLVLMAQTGDAQDPHFSQYFSSPLTLNPAATGNFVGAHRIAVNYRSQLSGTGNPYTTATFSFDTKILKDHLKDGDAFGVGLMGLYDQTAGGALNSSYLSFSAAYHKTIDGEGYQHLGIGFQGTLATRKLDYSKITFSNQFTGNGFDPGVPSGEAFQSGSVTYADFNAGAMYNYNDDDKTIYAGLSYYHLAKPRQSFYAGEDNRLSGRISVHAGGSFATGESGRLFLSGLYMKQGSSTDKALGCSYAYSLPEESTDFSVMAGCWYRFSDALYPYIGLQWNGFQAGITYDINTTNLGTAASRNRSFEISCIYTFRDNTVLKRLIPWY